jgi:hypothetical protein
MDMDSLSYRYDPNRGIGASLSTNASYNGRQEDSLFRALPYRHFASIQIGFFQREVWYGRVGYEWLWPKGRPYRIMLRMEARQDGQIQLWGPMPTRSLIELALPTVV